MPCARGLEKTGLALACSGNSVLLCQTGQNQLIQLWHPIPGAGVPRLFGDASAVVPEQNSRDNQMQSHHR